MSRSVTDVSALGGCVVLKASLILSAWYCDCVRLLSVSSDYSFRLCRHLRIESCDGSAKRMIDLSLFVIFL